MTGALDLKLYPWPDQAKWEGHAQSDDVSDLAAGRDVEVLCTREEARLIAVIRSYQVTGCHWSISGNEVIATFEPRLKGNKPSVDLAKAFLEITHDRT